MRRMIAISVVALAICAITTLSAQAGPFERAGLSNDSGRVLTDEQADEVRGGFLNREAFQANLAQRLNGLDRTVVQSRLRGNGRTLPPEGANINGARPQLNSENAAQFRATMQPRIQGRLGR